MLLASVNGGAGCLRARAARETTPAMPGACDSRETDNGASWLAQRAERWAGRKLFGTSPVQGAAGRRSRDRATKNASLPEASRRSGSCKRNAIESGLPQRDRLLAGPDRAGQAAVIHAVRAMPQGLSQFDTTAEDFNLLGASGGGVGGDEIEVLVGDEVFIMTVTQDRFKNVFAGTHLCSTATPRDHQLKSQKYRWALACVQSQATTFNSLFRPAMK